MRNIICAIAILFAGISNANAQAPDVIINNNTACVVYFDLKGDNIPNCGISYSTGLIAVAPFSTGISMNANATWAAASTFTGADIYDADNITCSNTGAIIFIGEPCNTAANTVPGYTIVNPSTSGCFTCGTVTATWTAGNGATATLDFN